MFHGQVLKVLQRTLRFQGFLALAQAGALATGRRGGDGVAGLAIDAGYADQAHRPFINRELADALQAITPGLRLELRPGRQTGPGDNRYLDTTRLTHDTGFAPAFGIATAVADYVTWRAGNPR